MAENTLLFKVVPDSWADNLQESSSVATCGYGRARAHPAPAVLGHVIRADP